MQPFIPFIDRLSDAEKSFYRSTNTYRQAALHGSDDRQALAVSTQAELRALDSLREIAAGVTSHSDMEDVRRAVREDSVLRDFVLDVAWSDVDRGLVFRSLPDSGWAGFLLGGDDSAIAPNDRDWSECLVNLVRVMCDEVRDAQVEMARARAGKYFCAKWLGNASSLLHATSRADVLRELERY